MSAEVLKSFLDKWELNGSQGAKVLKIQKSKVSEYLNGVRPIIPPYVLAHIETFNELPKAKAQKLIKRRLQRNKEL